MKNFRIVCKIFYFENVWLKMGLRGAKKKDKKESFEIMMNK